MRRLRLNGSGKTLLLIISLAFNFGVCIALAVQQQQPHEQGKPRWSRDRHDRDWLAKKLNLSAGAGRRGGCVQGQAVQRAARAG